MAVTLGVLTHDNEVIRGYYTAFIKVLKDVFERSRHGARPRLSADRPMRRRLRPMKIDFVSDVACPGARSGLWSLDRALERLGDAVDVELHFQPFELNPPMPAEGEDTDRAHRAQVRRAARAARPEPRGHPRARRRGRLHVRRTAAVWNTFDAHRLLHWAGLEGTQREAQACAADGLSRARREPGRARRAAARRPPRPASTPSARAAILDSDEYARRGARARAPLAAARHPLGAGGDHRRPPPDLGRPAAGVFERALREIAAVA